LGGNGHTNDGNTFVAWCWKAGGNKNTFNVDDVGYASAAAAGLTGGSINPTGASVGTKQGFSIVKWTDSGTNTIAHGLGSPLNFYIVKRYDGSSDWPVYHTSLGGPDKRLHLNSNSDIMTSTGTWNNTAPTSSVFSWGGGTGDDMVAYCWHDVPGLQKFGNFTGNGSTDGPFVQLGFRPAIVWVKVTDADDNWVVFDNARDSSNVTEQILRQNSGDQENTEDGAKIDFLSNGFKLRGSGGGIGQTNNNNNNYIYCAWAEAPTVNLYGASANAR